jgi:hypothetical protein
MHALDWKENCGGSPLMQLRPYQSQMVEHIIDRPRTNLFVPMGAGKTVSVLTALDMLSLVEDVFPVLVVAPLRVARSTWPDEIQKWPHLRHLTVSAITGNIAQRYHDVVAAARSRASGIFECAVDASESVALLVIELDCGGAAEGLGFHAFDCDLDIRHADCFGSEAAVRNQQRMQQPG